MGNILYPVKTSEKKKIREKKKAKHSKIVVHILNKNIR